MTKDPERMIADAKRAARRLARSCARSYQECLDAIAREAGRAHWSAFLSDPVDIRSNAGDATPSTEGMTDADMPGATSADEPALPRGSAMRISGMPGGEGIILGMDGTRLVRSSRQSTVLCVGAPGTGKTSGVVLPTIAQSPAASQIVHDQKPELLRAVLAQGLRSHSRLISIDILDDATPAGIERIAFNPLHPDFAAGADTWTHGINVASCLIVPERLTRNYFEERGRLLLATLCAYLTLRPDRIPAEEGRTRIASLPAIVDWIAVAVRGDYRAAFRQMARDIEKAGVEQAAEQASSLAEMASRELDGVIQTVEKALLVARNAHVRRVLEPYDVERGADLVRALEDRETPTTAFFCATAPEFPVVASLHALAIDLVARWRATKGPSARSLQIIVDEAMRLPTIPMVSTMLSEGAPAGTSLVMVLPDVDHRHGQRIWYSQEAYPAVRRFDHVVDMTLHPRTAGIEEIRRLAGMGTAWSEPAPDPDDGMRRHTVVDAHGPVRLGTPRLHVDRKTGTR